MIAIETFKGQCLMKLSQQPTRTDRVHRATVRDQGESDTQNQSPHHDVTPLNRHSFQLMPLLL